MYSERLRQLCQQIRLDDAVVNDIMTAPTPFTVRQPPQRSARQPRRGNTATASKGGPRPPATSRVHTARTSRGSSPRKSDAALARTLQKQGQPFIAPYFKKGTQQAAENAALLRGGAAAARLNAVWVYGCVEVKKTDSFEYSFQAIRRVLDKMLIAARRENAAAHVVFDIVATKTNIANGTPALLGEALYDYVADIYGDDVATCFVGLTDTTSKRVGRDIYCPCEEFSRRKYPFTDVDNVHMFIVEPK